MTLRGCDYLADNGVLFSKSEQERYYIVLVDLDGIGHGNVYKNGISEQHDRINKPVYDFIRLLEMVKNCRAILHRPAVSLNNTKAPNFTLLDVKLGACFAIRCFQRLLRRDRLPNLRFQKIS